MTTPTESNWVIPLAFLLATGVFLGLSTNLAKIAAGVGLEPLAFLAWSLVGSTTVLAVIGAVRHRLPPINARTIEYFVVSGLVSVAVPNLLSFAAVPRVGAGFVALSIAFPPLFTYLGALLLGMEEFQTRRAAGVAFALGGAALLAALKLSEPDADAFWIVTTLTAPVLLAVGNIYRTLRWPEGAAPDELAPGMLAASGLMLLVVGAITGVLLGGVSRFSLVVPTENIVPVLLIIAQTLTFSCMYLLFFFLQKHGGPIYLSLLGSVGAVVGVPIAVFLLGEAPPQGLAIGGLLIALGVGLLTFGDPQAS
ncbi:membrane protein [Halovivax asiaticus JCM 14624]|uniref:Membrane protein n=1 Tax=Halovivax asiaticus JCM 14624 TaxID=1227490 RepID=M0BP82_9EURY|nr:DMT family transporter [Halovivax asiaticus]ELZ12691.1 membrane protein [Halovivax asiaticus JCM 14624]